jgi:hypothetical protein
MARILTGTAEERARKMKTLLPFLLRSLLQSQNFLLEDYFFLVL